MCLDAVLNLAFALSLLCFVVMHISLLLSNTTSVEVINTLLVSLFTLFKQVYGNCIVIHAWDCCYLVSEIQHIPCCLGFGIMPSYLLAWQCRHSHACSLKSTPNGILFLRKNNKSLEHVNLRYDSALDRFILFIENRIMRFIWSLVDFS